MESYHKVTVSVVTAVILGFLSATVALFSEVNTLKLKVEYLEKSQESIITIDKLENAKLVLGQQMQQLSNRCTK